MTRDNTTRRQFIKVTGTSAAAVGGLGTIATASAETNTEGGVLGPGFAPEFELQAFVGGFMQRYRTVGGPPDDVEDMAARARNEFGNNEDLWLSYGNWLLDEAEVNADGDATVAVDFEITRRRWPINTQRTPTVIEVEADDRFEAVSWELGEAEDPDFEVTVANVAAESAADELSKFRREWIGENEDDHEHPSDEHLNELAGQYWDGISFGDSERSVIEVLLGEVDV